VVGRVPQIRADQRLRALRVGPLDLDHDAQPRRPAVDSTRRQQLGVLDHAGATVHAERVADAGDQEHQPHVRVLEDVAKRIRDSVAGTIGDQQRAPVEDANEAGRVTARRHVAATVQRRGRDAQERGLLDEPAGERVDVVGYLADDHLGGRADHLAKLHFCPDRAHASTIPAGGRGRPHAG